MSFFSEVARSSAPADVGHVVETLQRRPWTMASFSQIDTYRSCPSKWYLRQIGGIYHQSPSAALGDVIHSEIRTYLTEGPGAWAPSTDETVTQAREIILAAADHLPAAGALIEQNLEVAFALRSKAWPVPVIGAADYAYMDQIRDWKTSSDIVRARKRFDLPSDLQLAIYAAARQGPSLAIAPIVLGRGERRRVYPAIGCPTRADLGAMNVGHVYLRTQRPYKADSATATMEPRAIVQALDTVGETLEQMERTARVAHIRDVPHSAGPACYQYGKCHFFDVCAFLGRSPGRAPETATAAEESSVPNDNPWLDDFGGEDPLVASLNAQEQERAKAAGMRAPEEPGAAADGGEPVEKKTRAPKAEPRIPDHDAIPTALRGRARSALDAASAAAARNALAAAVNARGGSVGLPTDLTKAGLLAEIAELVRTLTGEAPWPAKAAPAPAPAAAKSEPAPAQIVASTPAPAAPAKSELAPGRLLFIDCQPRGGDAVELSDLLAPLQREIEAEKKVPHYLTLPYSDGPRLVAGLLHYRLERRELELPARLIVRRSSPCANECLPELAPLYGRECVIEASR